MRGLSAPCESANAAYEVSGGPPPRVPGSARVPDLVHQGLWGLLLAHFAIRQLMTQAAWPRGLDPDRLSFTHAVRVIKRKMPQAAAVPP